MGAAAFIIAEYLGVSYISVLGWAIVPTLLYYLGIFIAVEIDARRFGARRVDLAIGSPWQLLARFGSTGVGAVYATGLGDGLLAPDMYGAIGAFQSALAARSRLGIPTTIVAETLHSSGASTRDNGTAFPGPASLGASFNTSLVAAVGAVIGSEARAGGFLRGNAPVLQVVTDPRFGRFEEAFGECPFLVARMGVAMLLGQQGPTAGGGASDYLNDTRHVSCEAKHAVAYAQSGHDFYRADVSERTLLDVYMRPWRAAIREGGLRGLMVAHQETNGLPMHGQGNILTGLLRGPAFGGEQVISPRVQLVAAPRIANAGFANEDARAFELEDVSLFDLNRTPGLDRVESGSRLTYGAEYTLDRPGWQLRAEIGQSLRLNGDGSEFADGTGFRGRVSDVVGRTSLKIGRLVELTHRFRLDKDNFAVRRNEIDLTLGGRRSYVSAAYIRLNRNVTLEDLEDRQELRVAGRVAIARYWALFGNAIIDLTTKAENPLANGDGFRGIRHRVDIQYEDECFRFGIGWRRDYVGDRDFRPGNNFQITIAFKTLGQ
jgi:hypothetical protein